MTAETDLRDLLVLRGPSLESHGLLSLLEEVYRVRYVEDLESALDAMRETRFAAVLSDTADFLPLERGVVTQQAAVVLDTIGDGVAIIGAQGELVWANRSLRRFSPKLIEQLRSTCASVYEEFATSSQADSVRGKRFSLIPDENAYYEVICSPVRDRQGLLRQVAAVVVDASGQRRQQLKLNAIERAGQELVRLDYEVLRTRNAHERLELLRERMLRCSRDVLSYELFAVLLLDERTNRLELVIADGLDPAAENYELFATAEGNGIAGYVAATGSSYICPDVRRDGRYLSGMQDARSSITVPLRLHDKVIGVLNAESRQVSAFGEEDRQFAEMFANHVALALHILNLLVFERHSTRTQVSDTICGELTGPLNDMITDASNLMEDYIGHDDIRKRLGEIIDTANLARQKIQQLVQGPNGVVGSMAPAPKSDPLLTGKKILVADDEELIRQTVCDVLSQYGCCVETVADGAQAIERIEADTFDLVISDIKMPGADGYRVFSRAREIRPETKVILITGFGYDPSHSIVRANREGLSAVLFKPFKVKQLLTECRTALAPAQ